MESGSINWITVFGSLIFYSVQNFAPSDLRKTMVIDCVSEPKAFKVLHFMECPYKRGGHLAELLGQGLEFVLAIVSVLW